MGYYTAGNKAVMDVMTGFDVAVEESGVWGWSRVMAVQTRASDQPHQCFRNQVQGAASVGLADAGPATVGTLTPPLAKQSACSIETTAESEIGECGIMACTVGPEFFKRVGFALPCCFEHFQYQRCPELGSVRTFGITMLGSHGSNGCIRWRHVSRDCIHKEQMA